MDHLRLILVRFRTCVSWFQLENQDILTLKLFLTVTFDFRVEGLVERPSQFNFFVFLRSYCFTIWIVVLNHHRLRRSFRVRSTPIFFIQCHDLIHRYQKEQRLQLYTKLSNQMSIGVILLKDVNEITRSGGLHESSLDKRASHI